MYQKWKLLIQLGQRTLVVSLYVGFTSRVKWRIGFGHMVGLNNPRLGAEKVEPAVATLVDLPKPQKKAPKKRVKCQYGKNNMDTMYLEAASTLGGMLL